MWFKRHIKKYSISCFFMLTFLSAFAQNGLEWIVDGQSYYKMKVFQTGIYCIPYNQLQSSGINTSDLTNLQLWFRGKEQAIYLNNDTLFFYGKRNDGTLDSYLYQPGFQANTLYSLFSDTTAYFLTEGAAPGKRMVSRALPGSASNSTWYYEEYLKVFTDTYSRGKFYYFAFGTNDLTVRSDYDQGEGWFSKPIQSNGSPALFPISIPVTNPNTNASGMVQIEVQVSGAYTTASRSVSLLIGNSATPDYTFDFTNVSNFESATLKVQLPAAYLLNKTNITCAIRLFTPTFDKIGVTYIKVLYPRKYILSNSQNFLQLDNSEAGDKNIQLTTIGNPLLILNNTDEYNQEVIPFSASGINASLTINSTIKKVVIQNSSYNNISAISQVDMSLPSFTNEFNIIYPEIFESSAQSYMQYRSSGYGGNYSVEKCTFEKLCNLFSYGEFHSLAIKRFCTELINANSNEKYLLILGKGVTPALSTYFPEFVTTYYYRKNPEKFWSSTNFKRKLVDLVPTYGEPGSDLMFSIDANYAAQIHTGRVPARTNTEVEEYLEKVRLHESLDSNLIWRKQLVHLSGGEDQAQITLFKKFIDTYKDYSESPHFGGKVVKTYVKNLQNGAIDDQLISGVANNVNNGISLLTLFGHSSAEISDIDIGFVSNPIYGYNNTGKYPMLLMNGCTSANIFSNYSFAEDWINTPRLGAITVLGHTDIGYSNNMNQFSTYYYRFQFNDERYRNQTIGFIHKKIIDSINSVNSPFDIASQTEITQTNLSGDPALRMYNPSKTDYAIYGDNQIAARKCLLVSENGSTITAKDPFKILIPIDNYGSTTAQTVEIIIKRYVNNSLIKTYQFNLPPFGFKDSLSLSIINSDGNYAGNNRFDIQIDPTDSLKEIRKDNNSASLSYFMAASGVKCIFPLNYSVVSTQPVSLVAQPTNLLITETDYYFEIDTSKKFNSPYKQSKIVTAGSLPTWIPNLISDVTPSDSIVYFWRIRFKTIAAQEDTVWDNSSFIYIKNSNTGWSQTHIDQFQENNLIGLKYNKNLFKWEFPTTSVNLKVKTFGAATPSAADETLLSLNTLPILQPSVYHNCQRKGGLYLFILDRSSLEPKTYQPNSQGWFYCGQNFDTRYVQEITLPYRSNTPSGTPIVYGRDADAFINAIQNTNKNDLIVILNQGDSFKTIWVPALTKYFKDSLHALKIGNLTSRQQPFLLITKRNLSTPITEKVNLNTIANSFVTIDTVLTSFYDSGSICSGLIGPSSKWGKMYFAMDSSANDVTSLKMIRYSVTGNILDTIAIPKVDSINLNGTYLVDGVHTYCKLLLGMSDPINLTPAILKHWQIIYNGVPEGTLNPFAVGLDKYTAQTKAEGDTLTMTYRFDNISNLNFDKPIKVVYSIRNESGSIKYDTVTYTSLAANQNMVITYKVSTRGLPGKNYLQAYVNPQFQPEQYYSNNVIETSFTVIADKTQPVLEVAFDGVRIFDGDLVSASPLINITLKDNNKYLLMTDPNSVEMYLFYPNQTVPVQITSTNPMVQLWSLERSKTNTFVAEIKPKGLADGTYRLMVQGKDASGNKSGSSKYQINFKVENKPTISYFYPYPNPFSTSCRFVFTLSGTNVPADLKIQIMTVSGKIVKEIFKEQLGPMHIGNNISEYAWDGTDEYGDRLANGVYLYRVIIKDDTQYFEHRETAGDKAFKHDWGKLYILR